VDRNAVMKEPDRAIDCFDDVASFRHRWWG
jgi:hypothetical protein